MDTTCVFEIHKHNNDYQQGYRISYVLIESMCNSSLQIA